MILKEGGVRFLEFATDPGRQGENRTGTELALTSHWFDFGEPVYIGFRLRIPRDVDETNAFFYLMQFWQCAGASPLAGIRMSRGYSHRINFMTRGDSRAASMATYELGPDTWNTFVIKVKGDPTGENSSFRVGNDPDQEPAGFSGAYGYAEKGTCNDRVEPLQRFRLKFGIYKGSENGKQFKVNYDDLRIGNSFDAVSPWMTSSGTVRSIVN